MSEFATKDDVQKIVDKAVEDLSYIITDFAQQIDNRFNQLESKVEKLQRDVDAILKRRVAKQYGR